MTFIMNLLLLVAAGIVIRHLLRIREDLGQLHDDLGSIAKDLQGFSDEDGSRSHPVTRRLSGIWKDLENLTEFGTHNLETLTKSITDELEEICKIILSLQERIGPSSRPHRTPRLNEWMCEFGETMTNPHSSGKAFDRQNNGVPSMSERIVQAVAN